MICDCLHLFYSYIYDFIVTVFYLTLFNLSWFRIILIFELYNIRSLVFLI